MDKNAKDILSQELDIYRLQDWFHVPEFAEAFKYKVWELETNELKETIDAYQRQTETYRRLLYDDERQRIEASGKGEYPALYWFELTKFREKDWAATILDPWPPPQVPHYELMSEAIIAGVAESASELHKLSNLVVSHAWKDIPLHRETVIRCIRISPTHIVGTIRDKLNHWETCLEVEKGSLEEELDRALRVLLYRMHQQPGLNKAFIKRYITEMPKVPTPG